MEGASLAAVQHDETFGNLLDLTVKSELIVLFKQHVKMIIYTCLVCMLFHAKRVLIVKKMLGHTYFLEMQCKYR